VQRYLEGRKMYPDRTGECAKESRGKSLGEKSFENFQVHKVNYLVVVFSALV
jgi:hypothetical protein